MIIKPFSNQPVTRAAEAPAEDVRAAEDRARRRCRGRIGEGGLIKNRKRRENSRDDALGKLSTRPDRGAALGRRETGPRASPARNSSAAAKPAFGDRRTARRSLANASSGRSSRRASARPTSGWLPGSRPQGAGRIAARKRPPREARKSRKPGYGKPGGAKPFGKPRGEGRRRWRLGRQAAGPIPAQAAHEAK